MTEQGEIDSECRTLTGGGFENNIWAWNTGIQVDE